MDLAQGRNFIVNVVVGVVGAMIAILIYTPINGIRLVTQTGQKMVSYTKAVTGMVKTTAEKSLALVKDAIKTCKTAAVETVSKMAAATHMAIEWMAATALKIARLFGIVYREALDKVETLIDLLSRVMQRLVENVSRITKMSVEKVKDMVESAMEFLKESPKALRKFVVEVVVPAIRKKIHMTKKMAESIGSFISRYLPMYLRAMKYMLEYSLKMQIGTVGVHLIAVIMSMYMTLGQKFVGIISGSNIFGSIGDIITNVFSSIVSDYSKLQSMICNGIVDLILSTGFILPPIPLFGSNLADCTSSWIKTGLWISSRGLICKQKNPTPPLEFVRCLLGGIGDLEIIPYIPRYRIGPAGLLELYRPPIDLGVLGDILGGLPGQVTIGPLGPYTINSALAGIESKIVSFIETVQSYAWKALDDAKKEGNKAFTGIAFAFTGSFPKSEIRTKAESFANRYEEYILSVPTLLEFMYVSLVEKYQLEDYYDNLLTYSESLEGNNLSTKVAFDEIITTQTVLNTRLSSVITINPVVKYVYSLTSLYPLKTIVPVVGTYTTTPSSKVSVTLVSNPGYFVNEYVKLETIDGALEIIVAKIITVSGSLIEVEYSGSVSEYGKTVRLSPISLIGSYNQVANNLIVTVSTNRTHGYSSGKPVLLNFIDGLNKYNEISGVISTVVDSKTLRIRTTNSPPSSLATGLVSVSPPNGQVNKQVITLANHRLVDDIPLVIEIGSERFVRPCFKLDNNRLEVSIDPQDDIESTVNVGFSPQSGFDKYPTSIVYYQNHGYSTGGKVYIGTSTYSVNVITDNYFEIDEVLVGPTNVTGSSITVYPGIPDSGLDRLQFNDLAIKRKLVENIVMDFPLVNFTGFKIQQLQEITKVMFYGKVFGDLFVTGSGDEYKFINLVTTLLYTNPSNDVVPTPTTVPEDILELSEGLLQWVEVTESDPSSALARATNDLLREVTVDDPTPLEALDSGLKNILSSVEEFSLLKWNLATTDYEQKPKGSGLNMIADIVTSMVKAIIDIVYKLFKEMISLAVNEVSKFVSIPAFDICIGIPFYNFFEKEWDCAGYNYEFPGINMGVLANLVKDALFTFVEDILQKDKWIDLYLGPIKLYALAGDAAFPQSGSIIKG